MNQKVFKKYFAIPIVLFISSAVALGFTFLIDSVVDIPLLTTQTLSSVVSIFTSLILFSLGLVVYQKFSSSQSLIDKQTNKIIELITFLQSVDFVLTEISGTNRSQNYGYAISSHSVERFKKFRKKMTDKHIDYSRFAFVYNYSLLGLYKQLNVFASDPYTPKNIAESIKSKFTLNIISSESDIDQLVIVHTNGDFSQEKPISVTDEGNSYEDTTTLYNSLNGKKFSYDTLLSDLITLHTVSYDWLANVNSSVVDTLNITRISQSK